MITEQKARKLPVQQLFILSICRFAEPISLTSVCMYLDEHFIPISYNSLSHTTCLGSGTGVFPCPFKLSLVSQGRTTNSKIPIVPYLPEMIESFGVPSNRVSQWAGVTSAAFSLSQALTAIVWGWASDRFGRKPIILTAMICIMCTSLLLGFSRTLTWAIVARSLA